MAASYKKLWKLLIDKDMKKKDLIEKAEVSKYTIRKLTRGENVTTDVLIRICKVLECDIGDITSMKKKNLMIMKLKNSVTTVIPVLTLTDQA